MTKLGGYARTLLRRLLLLLVVGVGLVTIVASIHSSGEFSQELDAAFTVAPVSPRAGEVVTLTACCERAGNFVHTWRWDGESASSPCVSENTRCERGPVVTATFPTPGTFLISHRVFDIDDDYEPREVSQQLVVLPAATETPDVTTPAATQTPSVITTWELTISDIQSSCGSEEGRTVEIVVTQDGANVRVVGLGDGIEAWRGTLEGDSLIFGGDRVEGVGATLGTLGVTTATFNLRIDRSVEPWTLKGTEEWMHTQCENGSSSVSGTKIK